MKIKGAKVCISIGAESLSAYSSLCERAVCAGDVVELRVDYLHKIEFEKLSELIRSVPCETILTFRPKEQGGMSNASLKERIRFWSKAKKLPATFFDFESDLVFALKDDKEINWRRIIVSHHDFEKTPDDLETLYETMSQTPARILKIATQANDANDCIAHFRLLERAKKDGRELIAIAMGEAGKITRILAPLFGSFLTYAALDDEQATAPGQVTVKDLREKYRIDEINMDTKIYGLVGHPVSHSVSPEMHDAAFRHHGINAMYWTHDTKDISTFVEWLREKVFLNWRGASVTIPHKQTVMKHLDWIDETAKEIGAVNAIVIENNLLLGYNTDAKGFIEPLKNFYSDLRGARCAVIGAGGAARAVAWALKKESADITIFARDIERARKKFDVNAERLGDSKFSSFDIVINTTPLGTKGKLENETPATAEQLYGIGLVYDLVYNPLTTRFILEAQSVDVPTIGGLEMLVAQAAEQSKLWTGLDAPIDVMRKAAMEKLNG
jgi:3-dehydroquinate dehydratase/shikimate dehydrogenase